MALRSASAIDIPISRQHAFIDLAKEFHWQEVKEQINANPELVNVQPCGRDGTKRWSALHQAAYSGSLNAVSFLLEHNAALDARTNDGKTALDVAKNSTVKSFMLQFMGERDVREMPTPLRKRSSSMAGSGNGSLQAMKAMKAPKVKKAMKVIQARNIAKGKRSKTWVYKGQFVKTIGGLRKNDLTKNKSGKVVSKKLQTHGMKSYANIKTWVEAFMKARVDLGLIGFVAIKKGSALYSKTMDIYKS